MIYIIGDIDEKHAKEVIKEIYSYQGMIRADIHLTTYGGCISSAFSIGTAIKELKSAGTYVNIICGGTVASAGVYIALQGNSVQIGDCKFMVHRASCGSSGNQFEHATSVEYLKLTDSIYEKTISPILTEKQLKDYREGKDVFFMPNEKKINEYLKGR